MVLLLHLLLLLVLVKASNLLSYA